MRTRATIAVKPIRIRTIGGWYGDALSLGRACWVHPYQAMRLPIKERDACGDDAALAEPRMLATIGEEEFRDLDRNEDDRHAFKAEHEEEVKPVNSRVAAIARIRAGKRKRCNRCLLDDKLFGDGESKAEHQQAGCAAAPAANQLAAEESAAAPDHHFGNEHEEDAEARRSAEDLGNDGRKNEQRPDGAPVVHSGV